RGSRAYPATARRSRRLHVGNYFPLGAVHQGARLVADPCPVGRSRRGLYRVHETAIATGAGRNRPASEGHGRGRETEATAEAEEMRTVPQGLLSPGALRQDQSAFLPPRRAGAASSIAAGAGAGGASRACRLCRAASLSVPSRAAKASPMPARTASRILL